MKPPNRNRNETLGYSSINSLKKKDTTYRVKIKLQPPFTNRFAVAAGKICKLRIKNSTIF